MNKICLWCDKKTRNGSSIVQIPENEGIREKWLDSMEMDLNTNISEKKQFLCKKHFADEDVVDIVEDVVYDDYWKIVLLKYESIPKM